MSPLLLVTVGLTMFLAGWMACLMVIRSILRREGPDRIVELFEESM